jgi:alpha-1,3-glucan synthase
LWGEEQNFHLFDSTASNYLFGRQAMTSAQAWQDHGCYKLNSSQYADFGEILDAGKTACGDDWNSLDHLDPTAETRRYFQTMYYMRDNYPSLNDGFVLQKLSNHTDYIYLTDSNNTPTEVGLWSVSRSPLPAGQDFSKLTPAGNLSVWLLYTNMAEEIAYTFDCTDNTTALLSPYFGGTTVKNLFYPYETYSLQDSTMEFYANGSAPFFGCLSQIDMVPYSFKALVPEAQWIEMYPVVTSFSPGHDTRILANSSISTIELEFKFSQNMSCDSVSKGMTFKSVTETGATPQVQQGSVSCTQISPPENPVLVGALPSVWSWKASIQNVAPGVHQITLTNISNSAGTDSTRVPSPLILRADHFIVNR